VSHAPPDPTALPSPFDAHLVNGPFGDPALFVDLVHSRRAFLVDAGDLAALAPRKLLRVTDILVSHAHMDHWSGFDHFLRLALGRERTVRLFGPPGMVERVEHKLRAYTWNLLEGYGNELAFEVTEIGEPGPVARAAFRLRAGFAREPLAPAAGGPTVVEDPNLRVTAATLDHGTPCLAYAIEERVHVNVWKNRLAELGLGTGPWLAELKTLVVAGAPDDTPVHARWREGGRSRAERFALGWLKERLLHIVRGRKLAYVTDAAWTPDNIGRIIELARDAEILFIEAPFLDRDRERAATRRHLTARQAGVLARRAGVRRVVPFHFSPRHAHEESALRGEVEAAFAGGEGVRAMPTPA
jgi:ribonuclease Z